MARLLIVEDEDQLARALKIGFEEENYVVDRAADGEEGLWMARAGHHDALLVDVRMPKMDGIELCRRIRGEGLTVPVMMLTAADTTDDVIEGLDVGADDYVTKPFEFAELLARVRALLRRGSAGGTARLRVADLEIDTRARRAFRSGRPIPLSALEYRLLEHLVSDTPGRSRVVRASPLRSGMTRSGRNPTCSR